VKVCVDCGKTYASKGAHMEECRGAVQPVREVAEIIARGGAFRDVDAVRVSRAYLELLDRPSDTTGRPAIRTAARSRKSITPS
jgi:hypothetical protein